VEAEERKVQEDEEFNLMDEFVRSDQKWLALLLKSMERVGW
jgi:hypothetical protein